MLNRNQDAASWRKRYARGETMDVTPYGYERAEPLFDMSWSTTSSANRIWQSLHHRASRLLGFDVFHVWSNRRLLYRSDVIWTHTEREHLGVALLQRFRPRSRRIPVLAQSVWLWDEWVSWGWMRRRFVSWLLSTHPVEVVHSRVSEKYAHREVSGRRVVAIPFGSAAVTRDPAVSQSKRRQILAVGNDTHRDWATFAAAASLLDDVDIRIASRSKEARDLSWPEHVTIAPTGSHDDLAELYRRADVVVIPTKPNLHASGSTACIEALAARCRVVVTAVGGIDDYCGDEAIYVPPGDAQALAAGIRNGMAQDAITSDSWIERGLTQGDYVARYVLLTRWLLGEIPWPEEVGSFAPVLGSAELSV